MSVQSIGSASLASQLASTPPPTQATDSTVYPSARAGIPADPRASVASTTSSQPENNAGQSGKPSQESLEHALRKVNDFVGGNSQDVVFSVDKDTDISVVKVVDRQTKEIIRQIPSEEVIQISKALDKLQGLLVRERA